MVVQVPGLDTYTVCRKTITYPEAVKAWLVDYALEHVVVEVPSLRGTYTDQREDQEDLVKLLLAWLIDAPNTRGNTGARPAGNIQVKGKFAVPAER
jgi:hypothetical protein